MKSKFLLAVMLLCADIAISENAVTFEATASPGFLNFEGKGGKVKGAVVLKDGKASGTFEVDLTVFDTGLPLRNEHMKKKYLEVEKFPKAKLVLAPVLLPKGGYFNWTGELTIHGVTKTVTGSAFIEDKQIEAKFSVNTPDFGIKKASYANVGVDEKINLLVRLDLPG